MMAAHAFIPSSIAGVGGAGNNLTAKDTTTNVSLMAWPNDVENGAGRTYMMMCSHLQKHICKNNIVIKSSCVETRDVCAALILFRKNKCNLSTRNHHMHMTLQNFTNVWEKKLFKDQAEAQASLRASVVQAMQCQLMRRWTSVTWHNMLQHAWNTSQ